MFAAVNMMYAAVSARTAQIATLRAIGFGAGPVVISIIAEALALAVLGAITGTSLVVGVIGGLFPAIRAVRMPVAQALQQR